MITNAELAEGGNDLTTLTSDTNINFMIPQFLNIGFLNNFVPSDVSRLFQILEVRKKHWFCKKSSSLGGKKIKKVYQGLLYARI